MPNRYSKHCRCSNAILAATLIFITFTTVTHGGDFEPYAMHGGLVAAVAGKDYVVLATDTRLSGSSGYDILERQHIASRLWSIDVTPSAVLNNNDVTRSDGSLRMPADENTNYNSRQQQEQTGVDYRQMMEESTPISSISSPYTIIASSGCQPDCEALKRILRANIRADVTNWKSHSNSNGSVDHPKCIAQLLSNTLYQRRGFPYYSFCLVAGLGVDETRIVFNDLHDSNANVQADKDDALTGHVYVYDAIGSYERVAAAANGPGKEMLQPILDHLFAATDTSFSTSTTAVRRKSLTVSCSVDETLKRLVRAFRAVSERNIGVGDSVVLCVISRDSSGDSSRDNEDSKNIAATRLQVYRDILKQH